MRPYMPLRMMCMCAHDWVHPTPAQKKLPFQISFLFAKKAPWDQLADDLADFRQKCPGSDRGWHFQKSCLAKILVVRTN